jgi:hypothetical protein
MKKTRIVSIGMLLVGAGAMAIGLLPQPALVLAQMRGNVVEVTDAASLSSAVLWARAGTTIRLAAGDYPRLVVRREIDGQPIRITGPRGARIDQAVFLKAAGWHLEGVTIIGGTGRLMPLDIASSRNIVVSNVHLTGATPGPGPDNEDSNGLVVRGSEAIVFAGSEVDHVKQIAGIRDSFGVVIEGNRFTNAREGLMVRATHGLAIRNNLFQGWRPRFDKFEHPDMIQFFTQHVPTGSSMVTIQGNYLSAGEDRAVQGIFIRAEAYEAGREPMGYHRNFVISDNVYFGSSRHGISTTNIRGLIIENNTVIGSPHAFTGNVPRDPTGKSSYGWQPAILVAGKSWGRASNNIAALMAIRPEVVGMQDINNFVYKPRDLPDGRNPGNSFNAPLTAGDLPISAFAIRPGSDAARHQRGADVRKVGPEAAVRDLQTLAGEAATLAANARLQDLTKDPPLPK